MLGEVASGEVAVITGPLQTPTPPGSRNTAFGGGSAFAARSFWFVKGLPAFHTLPMASGYPHSPPGMLQRQPSELEVS